MKLDENNQYGFAKTKLMPVRSIKEKKTDLVEFNFLIQKVTLGNKIGHFVIVDIEFDYENVAGKQIIYNKIYPPLTDNQKKLDANDRLMFQICELYSKTTEKEPKSYRATKKLEAILIPKQFIPLYLEHLKFSFLRCGCKVTKSYSHFIFEQSRFKKTFL